jgi:hypothetical protein
MFYFVLVFTISKQPQHEHSKPQSKQMEQDRSSIYP